ncbi:unnamed protein product [Mycena citricolor]|uniref:N-acetylglucosaminylphosphatidylinositol deacetylase n=1 Tax=Mycena citricolor TaxID=2018698 RepID=A0AAD2HCM1_9AGAR|nr:unnamed protein product [Mycena citricolor]
MIGLEILLRRGHALILLLAVILVLPTHPKWTDAFHGNVLLLTAHPDDECMFFAPTLLALRSSRVHALCLSVGDADGLGGTRKREFEYSLDLLGVGRDQRRVLDHPDLQDNFTQIWNAQSISDVLSPVLKEWNIDTILTFDAGGVSGHPNHRSLPEGVLVLQSSTQTAFRAFTLITTPLPTKYIGVIAPVWEKLRSLLSTKNTITFVSSPHQYVSALAAMRAHASQLVWFRWLYVMFSRYMWVNEWIELA